MSIIDVGYICLVGSLILAVYSGLSSLFGSYFQSKSVQARGLNTTYLIGLLMAIASSTLVYSFISQDFGVRYVALHSNKAMPFYYTVAAFYSGQEGSLLYWATLLSVFWGITVFVKRMHRDSLTSYANILMMPILIFFFSILIFKANPMERLPMVMTDGQGLNPLLRDPGMLIHPPMLLAGYLSWTIPFVFGIGALISGDHRGDWVSSIRKPTLIAWALQSAGLVLGGWWAYHVLGWGGYWGWDPVENVALLPWLTGTAFLHSIMVVERRKKLQIWSISLLIATFSFSIFGTFIVRSGILSSVHNFAESEVGHYFLAFFAISLLGSILTLLFTSRFLKDNGTFDSATSKESGFLVNNTIFIALSFATFWGTVYPMVSEALGDQRITVGAPFYEKVNGPLFALLLLLMGVGPLLNWNHTSYSSLKQKFLPPIIISILVIAFLFLLIDSLVAAVSFGICSFALISIISEYIRATKSRANLTGQNHIRSLLSLVSVDRRKYGGYLIHISIVVMAIGIISSSGFQTKQEVNLIKGQELNIGRYTLTYSGTATIREDDKNSVVSQILVKQKGSTHTSVMHPKTQYYDNYISQPTSRVAIISFPMEDLYIFQSGVGDDSATFAIFINPLIILVWVGSSMIIMSLFIIFWPAKKDKL